MMMEFSKKPLLPLLAVVALGVAGCPIQAGDQIPCVEDVTCPAQYPVCGPTGKCIAGTSGARASEMSRSPSSSGPPAPGRQCPGAASENCNGR